VRILISSGHELLPFEESEEEITVADFLLANIMDDLIDIFDNDLYKLILEDYAQKVTSAESFNHHQYFINHTNDEVSAIAAEFLSDKYEYSEYWEKSFYVKPEARPEKNFEKDCHLAILRLKFRKINKLISKNTTSINEIKEDIDQEGTMDRMDRALKIHARLIAQRNEIAALLKQVVV